MKNINVKLTYSITLIFCVLTASTYAQTVDTLSGKTTYRNHRFTPDYQFMLFTVFGNHGQTQKIYSTSKKEFIDWDEFPKEQYQGHLKYNLYERYNREHYLQTYLSTVKNTGEESKHMYDIVSHKPIILVPTRSFVRLLNDGSFLYQEEGKKGRSGQYYIMKTDGSKKKLSHKFPSKFKPPTEMDISYDGKYGSFKRSYYKDSETFQAFEIQNLVEGKVLDFTPIKDEKVIKIAYVTDDIILYECSKYYIVADWNGTEICKLNLDKMLGGGPNKILNSFYIDNKLYLIQQNSFKIGRDQFSKTRIIAFDKNTGEQINLKSFTSAVDIVPVKDNEFMVLYPDYNEHLDRNFDVNLRRGVGEGIAVEYIDSSFEVVEFKYLQNSTREASLERWQPEYPNWVTGIRKFQIVEHEGFYKMVTQKELFGFRLSDNTYIKNSSADKTLKLANQVDPNLFLCDCINKYCHGGFVQNTVRPAKQFDTKFVKYVTSSSGVTYKKTTTFKAGDDTPYSYKTKCEECNGDGFYICKGKVRK